MATYEITLLYPDRPLDAHRAFLQEVGRNPRSGLLAFHPYLGGLALTVRVDTDLGRGIAVDLARQKASRFWPNYRAAGTLPAAS